MLKLNRVTAAEVAALEEEAAQRQDASSTIQSRIDDWLAMQRTFEPQLQATAVLFAHERWAALAELQARLQRLAEWQQRQGRQDKLDS